MTVCPIDSYTSRDWPRVSRLLTVWPFKPLAGHDTWPAERLTSLCLARARTALAGPAASAWVATKKQEVSGLAQISELEWDSEQIGMRAARLDYLVAAGSYAEQVEIKRAMVATALGAAMKKDVQHVSARVDASDLTSLHVLESAGFITVDAILTFALNLKKVSVASPERAITLKLATGADSEAAAELARTAYAYDRFHADPSIDERRANELHGAWLRNSCQGAAADAVILAEDAEGLLGFVTCKIQRDTAEHLGKLVGTIVLVATAERARGKGVARAATLSALEWFRQQQVEIVEVGTQLRNIPASRVYQGCGFRLVASSISLRKVF
jgi:dTDP-4-amino-4,6-dideoxy-D-galactose acyltransferase